MNIYDVSTAQKVQEEERQKLKMLRNKWISSISHDIKRPSLRPKSMRNY